MIVTVTANPALDVTYRVDRLRRHTVHRVRAVHARAGGKGVNVARILHTLGHDVLAAGLAGGQSGEDIRTELTAAGIRHALLPVRRPARRTVTVVDDADATAFHEPGGEIAAGEWAEFRRRLTVLAKGADVVTLSGSLPPGVGADGYAQLTELARAAGARVVVDTGGPALLHAAAARPAVVKPNATELLDAGAADVAAGAAGAAAAADLVAPARRLVDAGAGAVVVSLGRDGLLAVTARDAVSVPAPAQITGNPTGAGDAVVAALAVGLVTERLWQAVLDDAAALGAAAVLADVAGDVDLAAYRRLRRGDAAHSVG